MGTSAAIARAKETDRLQTSKLGPAPSSVEDDDEDIAQAGCSNTLTAAIKNALSGTATRIVMSGKTVWRRDCGIDHKAIALINQTLRPLV